MDHEGTREQLELAAVEPGGLERLMAGDTATAQAVAAHLAGCASCSDELVRLGRASAAHPRGGPRAAAAGSQGADAGRHPDRRRPTAARGRRRTVGRRRP